MAPRTPAVDVSNEASLRHDLLAAVHTLLGAVELLLTTRLTARQRRYVSVCRRSADALTELSRKVSAQREERTFERVAIDDLAELGVMYLPKPVTRSQLVEAVKGVDGGRRLRILAADDSPESCALIDQFLKGTAKRIEIVNDGLSALEKYQHGKYDLLVIDLDMPVMDGRTAVRKIREWETDHNRHHIPVIVLTAHDLIAREAERPVSLAEPENPGDEIVHEPDPEIAPLVMGFLSACRRDVATILRAMTDSNYVVIGALGHTLKGTGAGFGFARVSAIGARLEAGAGRQDFEQIRDAVRELSKYLDRVRIAPVLPAREESPSSQLTSAPP
jgi:CheY-like chemotaxis protein/HPt (histidine-containing phosphotransfer) domain-containing protein